MSIVLSAQKRQTFRRPMPRRRGGRAPPERSRAMSGHLPVAREIAVSPALALGFHPVAVGTPCTPPRVRRRVLGLTDRDEAQHRVHEGQVSFDLLQRLRRRAILEQDVERAPLLCDEIGEVAETPLLYLAYRPTLLLDERPDA